MKKAMKKTYVTRLFAGLLLAFCMAVTAPSIIPQMTGCATVEAATKVKLNKKKATLTAGAKLSLKVNGTSKKVKWSSSNKKVAKVSSKGKVTAVKAGKATITAKVAGKSYKCKVTVVNAQTPTTTTTTQTTPANTQQNTSSAQNIFRSDSYNIDYNMVSIYPRYVRYEDGKLIAECFVVNGCSRSAYNITVENLEFSNQSGLIAKGYFGRLDNLVIPSHGFAIMTFTFGTDIVYNSNADLSVLKCVSRVSNYY
jgi:hypothetical protein